MYQAGRNVIPVCSCYGMYSCEGSERRLSERGGRLTRGREAAEDQGVRYAEDNAEEMGSQREGVYEA